MTDTTPGSDSGARVQAREKTQEVAGQAQDKAQQAAGQAKSRLRDEVDRRSTDAGVRVQDTGSDIRGVGEELRKQGKDQPAKLADQAAERAERFGGYLERSDGDTILRDVEDFGRRQPWAVVLGGVALGIVASRLLKASSERRYEESQRRVSGDLSSGAWSSDRDLAHAGGAPQTAATAPMAER